MGDHKYLYVTIPSKDFLFHHTTCVEECPGKDEVKKVDAGETVTIPCNINDNYNVTHCENKCDAAALPYFYDYT